MSYLADWHIKCFSASPVPTGERSDKKNFEKKVKKPLHDFFVCGSLITS